MALAPHYGTSSSQFYSSSSLSSFIIVHHHHYLPPTLPVKHIHTKETHTKYKISQNTAKRKRSVVITLFYGTSPSSSSPPWDLLPSPECLHFNLKKVIKISLHYFAIKFARQTFYIRLRDTPVYTYIYIYT